MSAQDLQDALEAPDVSATNEALFCIVADGVSADAASPAIIEAYLRTFCDSTHTFSKRRWVGIALCKMIQSSAQAVTYLKRPVQGLTGLGEVILTTAELEETKIVAGLIIREGLARGVKYLSFWPNDKIQNSAPHFPRDAGPRWMHEFQQFLETLVDVAVTERVHDVDLSYVVSLVASDGYKWKEPNDTPSVLLLQRQHLVIMSADPTLQKFQFVDIPLSHIQSVRRKRTALHDSQGQQTKLSPWDVVLKLKPGSWTYRVNASEHSGREFSMMLTSEENARECESAISDLGLPPMVSSGPIQMDRIPNGESEGESVARVARLGRTMLADIGENVGREGHADTFAEETVPSTEPTFRRSIAKNDSGNSPVTRRASKMTATVSRTTDIESSSSAAPHKPTSKDPLTGENATLDKPDSSLTAAHKQVAQRKPGALPTVKKPSSSSATTKRQPLGHSIDESFEFPAQSPRFKRSTLATTTNSSENTNSAAHASKDRANAVTRAKPIGAKPKSGPPPRKKEAGDVEGHENPLTQPSFRTRAQGSSLRSSALDSRTKEQAPSSSAAVPSSNLPKISKRNDAHSAKSRRADPDAFDIPQDDELGPKLRAKRKRTKSVTYKEGETSEEESSGSEYASSKRRKTRSPPKRSQVPKAANSKTSEITAPKAKKSSKTRPTGAKIQAANPSKPSLLSKLISKPPSYISAGSTKPNSHPKAVLEDKENTISGRDCVSKLPVLPNTTVPGSEIHILAKLNKTEGDNKYNVIADQSSRQEHMIVPRKRAADSSLPATPSRIKWAKVRDAEQDGISVRPPSTNAPVRVLKDPSSPCRRQSQRPSDHGVVESGRSMKAPARPTIGPFTHVESHSQHYVGSKQRPDRRHTPMHQHGKRIHSGGSANVELLSSNSKPTPASPHAESTAISGHADPHRVNMEREMGEYEIEKNDPFNRPNSQKLTSFTRRLTGDGEPATDEAEMLVGASLEMPIELGDSGSSSDTDGEEGIVVEPPKQTYKPAPSAKTALAESIRLEQPARRSRSRTVKPAESEAPRKTRRSVDAIMQDSVLPGPPQPVEETQMIKTPFRPNNVGMDGDTLVEEDNELPQYHKETPVHFGSSPPPLDGSPSSHSSTSAEAEPRTDPPFPTSQAEEMDWEASLKPHQRSLHEQLLRVSSRVMRHVVDNETAVDDIAEMFARDGKHVLETLVDRHNSEFKSMSKDVEKKKGKMRKASEQLLQKLDQDRQALHG